MSVVNSIVSLVVEMLMADMNDQSIEFAFGPALWVIAAWFVMFSTLGRKPPRTV